MFAFTLHYIVVLRDQLVAHEGVAYSVQFVRLWLRVRVLCIRTTTRQ